MGRWDCWSNNFFVTAFEFRGAASGGNAGLVIWVSNDWDLSGNAVHERPSTMDFSLSRKEPEEAYELYVSA
jgi:hypothetical protein